MRSYNALQARLRAAALAANARIETAGEFTSGGRSYPLLVVCAGSTGEARPRVMIAAGIHGDEPAGVEAALRFLEALPSRPELTRRFGFTLFPCNNPTGWERNTRENADGIDLNREFAARRPAREVAIIMRALAGRCFDLVFEMHEDVDSPGFYLYEIVERLEEALAERIVASVREMGFPIDLRPEIEGLPATGGIIRPRRIRFRKTHLPQAIYTYRTCGGHVLTLEPPASKLPIDARVQIELAGLEIALGEGKVES